MPRPADPPADSATDSPPAQGRGADLFHLVTIYRRVEEEDVLERFFSGTHLPLAEQLPGLQGSEVVRVSGKPGGESRFHLQYTLHFASETAFLHALTSPAGLALMQALRPWAQARLLTWFHGEAWSEGPPTQEEE